MLGGGGLLGEVLVFDFGEFDHFEGCKIGDKDVIGYKVMDE